MWLNGHFRVARRGLWLAALVLTAALAAGCGSSSSSSSSSGSASTSSSSGLTEARALLTKYSSVPTTIGTMSKIGKAIPSGKVIAFVDSGIPPVHANVPFLTAAAAQLGWHVVDVPAGTTEAANQAAWNTILRMKPSFVDNNSGFPTSTFAGPCKQLAADHIPVFDNSVPRDQAFGFGGCVKGIVNDERQIQMAGEVDAYYMIAKSGGKANILVLNVPQIPILTSYTSGVQSAVAKLCHTCSVSVLGLDVSDLGTSAVPTKTIGYLRSHPNLDYVAASDDTLFSGLPSALRGAGISNVTLVGQTPEPSTIVNVAHGGAEKAAVMYDQIQANWKMVDMMARYSVGLSLAADQESPDPFFLTTSDNVNAWPGPASKFPWPTVADYKSQYTKLWK